MVHDALRKLIGVSLLLTACGGLPAVTSGHVGCAESDITISDERVGWSISTWTAKCHQKTFYCSRITSSGDSSQTSCKEATPDVSNVTQAATPPSAAPQAPQAPQADAVNSVEAGGCKYDTQCKGDRVCERGVCVTPGATPTAAPAPTPAPAATP